MNDSFTIDLMSHLTGQLEASLRAMLPEVIRHIQDTVSIPVGRAGSLVIRSNPGEPPRLETGNLRASIDGDVVVSGESVSLVITASAIYAGYLEQGTPRMEARPFLQPALEYWLQEIPRRLTDELKSTL